MKKVALLLLLCLANIAVAGDMKIVTRQTSDLRYDRPSTVTVYFQGQRQRREFQFNGETSVSILQCDLHRDILLNPATKTYTVTEIDEQGRPKTPMRPGFTPASRYTRSGQKVTITENVTDTGESKDFFGMTARHLIKNTKTEPQKTSCSSYGDGQTVDGWYVEAPVPECVPARKGVVFTLAVGGTGHCVDDLQAKHTGPYITGIPIQQTTTSLGKYKSTTRIEPVEISQQPLDPKLFEIPPGYTEYSPFDATMRYYWERLKDAVGRVF